MAEVHLSILGFAEVLAFVFMLGVLAGSAWEWRMEQRWWAKLRLKLRASTVELIANDLSFPAGEDA